MPRKLTRNQKIGITAASVIAAAGATAAVVLVQRRVAAKRTEPFCLPGPGGQQTKYDPNTGRCEPLVGQGAPEQGFVDPLQQAIRRLCMRPNNMTLKQMEILQNEVFIPIYEAMGKEAGNVSTEQQPTVWNMVADQAIAERCSAKAPATVEWARKLSYGAWLKWNGMSGQ